MQNIQGMQEHKKGFIFAQENDKKGDNDASTIFIPRARKFAQHMNGKDPVLVDTLSKHGKFEHSSPYEKGREKIFKAMRENGAGLDYIAFFGHGMSYGLLSAGIFESKVGEFANLILSLANPGCKVIFYACSIGAQGGFGEKLGELLRPKNCTVFAHTKKGRACANPLVVRYPHLPDKSPFLIEPDGPLWDTWQHALKDGYWKRFPFITKEQVIQEMEARIKPKAHVAAKPGVPAKPGPRSGPHHPHHLHHPHHAHHGSPVPSLVRRPEIPMF